MLSQPQYPSTAQSNLILINNQQMHGHSPALAAENPSLYQTDSSMMRNTLMQMENQNLLAPKMQQMNHTFMSDQLQKQVNSNTLYPSNNCVNAYLNNFNNTNYHAAATMLGGPSMNAQAGNSVYAPSFGKSNDSNYGVGMHTLGGMMNPQLHQTQQQLRTPNQQQLMLQQSSVFSQVAPESQNSNLYAGYISQIQNGQPGMGLNMDLASKAQQQPPQQMYQAFQQQPNAFQQYPGFIVQPNFMQSQNTFSPISLQNIYSEQQNSAGSALPSQTMIQPFYQQALSQGNLTSLPQNEQEQALLFQKQSSNLNQLFLSSHQISQKTANSQKSSASKESLLNNQELVRAPNQEKGSQLNDSQLELVRKSDSSKPAAAYVTATSGREAAQKKNQISMSNFDNVLSQIIINKASLQQQNRPSLPFIIKKQEEEDQFLQSQQAAAAALLLQERKNQFSQIQINKKISFDQSSSSAPQQILQSSHLRACQQSIEDPFGDSIAADEVLFEQSHMGRHHSSRSRVGHSLGHLTKFKKVFKDQSSQLTISSSSSSANSSLASSPPSKKQDNQLTSKYRPVSDDKSVSNQQNDNNIPFDQQSSLVEVYVDNRRRSTSIDHSFYLQLGALLNDKKVIDEFTNLILFQGTEHASSSNLNLQLSDSNSLLFRGNNEAIKKYTQLLNQTFYEMKFTNQLPSITPYSPYEEQTLKCEESDDDQEFKQANLSSFNQKTQKVNSIVESIQKAILTKIPLLFKEDYILDSLKLIPSGQYQVYSNLQNMCIQFVRGEKRKRFKERNKDSQYMSRFHNLNRLFFYQIMSMYSYESLSCFQIDPTISEQLRIIISFIKIHSKLQFINSKSKNSSVSSINQVSQQATEQSQKTDKRKRSHSLNEDHQAPSAGSTKQGKKDNLESATAAQSKISISKKQQKINEKQVGRNSQLQSDSNPHSLMQESASLCNMTPRNQSNKNQISNGQDSLSMNDTLSRNRASTYGESTNTTCERVTVNPNSGSVTKTYLNAQQSFCTIQENENSEHVSSTPSPVFKSLNNDNQETLKKSHIQGKNDFFSLSNETDANQVTAKKYPSANQDQNESVEQIQVENEDLYNQKSQAKQLKNFPEISKVKATLKKGQKAHESEISSDNKLEIEDSGKEEIGEMNDDQVNDNFNEEEDDEDDQDINFPIKNYKKYYRILKVENYTHSHYNTLFLKLNASSMGHLKKQSKDVDSHWLAYKIDLRNPELIPPEKIQFVNIMKSLFYKIFMHFNNFSFANKQAEQQKILEAIMNDPNQPMQKDSVEFKQIELRLDYYLRVVQGIQKLNQGYYSHKF